jgi:hypothetical protein
MDPILLLSYCEHRSGPVAQRLEQRTHNPLVPGSNPGGPTNDFSGFDLAQLTARPRSLAQPIFLLRAHPAVGCKLPQGVFQTFRCLLQLPLERLDLLGYVLQLLFGNQSCLGNLVSCAVGFPHGGPNSHRHSGELVLFRHLYTPS